MRNTTCRARSCQARVANCAPVGGSLAAVVIFAVAASFYIVALAREEWVAVVMYGGGNSTFTESLDLSAGLFSARISYSIASTNDTLSNYTYAYTQSNITVCEGSSEFFSDTGYLQVYVDPSLCHQVRATRGLLILALLLLPVGLFFRLRRRQHRIGGVVYAISGLFGMLAWAVFMGTFVHQRDLQALADSFESDAYTTTGHATVFLLFAWLFSFYAALAAYFSDTLPSPPPPPPPPSNTFSLSTLSGAHRASAFAPPTTPTAPAAAAAAAAAGGAAAATASAAAGGGATATRR